jgi:hypothetical protein
VIPLRLLRADLVDVDLTELQVVGQLHRGVEALGEHVAGQAVLVEFAYLTTSS